jgi:hypothetical protein
MSVPTHGPYCESWVFPTECRDCNQAIWIFCCTCGSAVLFDELGFPWPKHKCSGERLPTGWEAVHKLRSLGVVFTPEVNARLAEIAFGKKTKVQQERLPAIAHVEPTNERKTLIAMLREFNEDTKRTKSLEELGPLGYQILSLNKAQKYAQITIHVIPEKAQTQRHSYTCLLPISKKINSRHLGRLVGVELRGVALGSNTYWIVENIELL